MNTSELENLIWSWVKNGYPCPECRVKFSGRVMFKQWRKNYRILCPDCETKSQLLNKGYNNLQAQNSR